MPELEGAAEYDYVVVGSGAGGGPLAANLARAGYTVVLLEAGGDTENVHYRVPAFHPKASEDESVCWNFFVRHFESDERQRRDPKYSAERGGVLYPRSGVLGGCTAHNAMIFVYPHNADWEHLADLTGDPSWKPAPMRELFERVEDCRYRPVGRLFGALGLNPSRHGFGGWLQTENVLPREVLRDDELVKTVLASLKGAFASGGNAGGWLRGVFSSQLDPNAWSFVRGDAEGVCFTPLATRNHARNGTREYLQATAREFPDRLRIEVEALATRVLLDGDDSARGVEYLKGARLYRADPHPNAGAAVTRRVRARREVIVSGGAFNSPQLLMLSGIGPRAELESHGIRVRVELPGVGRNLQDRYEVSVVTRLRKDWEILKGARYGPDDPQFAEWERQRKGMYATNGALLAVVRRSRPEVPLPDLFLMALVGHFRGYYPGYADDLMRSHDCLSWTVLKAHTKNDAGTVSLRSNDPRDTPLVNFRYFEEGSDAGEEDLDAVVTGIELARAMTEKMGDLVREEVLPGKSKQSRDELRQFVREQAWGHHASCTCKIGRREDPMAVLDGDFRVYGTRRLRVVDASVFPRIPGFFIASAVYMISEKATDAVLKTARSDTQVAARQ